MSILHQTLESMRPGAATTYGGLSVFPLAGKETSRLDYLTLDEALERGVVEIGEVSQGGSVPNLQVRNSADKPVFLLDGEELVGAKQNRVLNLTILVPAKSTVTIPVSCVEQGRWTYRSPTFKTSGRMMFHRARVNKAAQVSESLLRTGTYDSDQGAIWDQLSMKARFIGAHSATGAMSAIYDETEGTVADYLKTFKAQAGQHGAVFAMNGEIVGVEIFDRASTWTRLSDKVVSGYAVDAMEGPDAEHIPAPDLAASFLRTVAEAQGETFPSVGLGQCVRLHGPDIVGGALEHDAQIVHLAAFRRASGSGGRGRAGEARNRFDGPIFHE